MGKLILKVLLVIVVAAAFGLGLFSYRNQNSQLQERFLNGTIPPAAGFPNGDYDGSSPTLPNKIWLGKTFDRNQSTGINMIQSGETVTQKFPFRTWSGSGLMDKKIDVIKIDYDVPENPFWLRMILDEIVQESPTHYLGKVHLRILGTSFNLGYFELEQSRN